MDELFRSIEEGKLKVAEFMGIETISMKKATGFYSNWIEKEILKDSSVPAENKRKLAAQIKEREAYKFLTPNGVECTIVFYEVAFFEDQSLYDYMF